MTAGRDADAYAPEWPRCCRCGTRRPRAALCPLIVNFNEMLRCLDVAWCERQGHAAATDGATETEPERSPMFACGRCEGCESGDHQRCTRPRGGYLRPSLPTICAVISPAVVSDFGYPIGEINPRPQRTPSPPAIVALPEVPQPPCPRCGKFVERDAMGEHPCGLPKAVTT